MNNVSLKRAIMDAWGIGPHQIAGGPDWLDADAFEISARAETPVEDAPTLNAMLRTFSPRGSGWKRIPKRAWCRHLC